LGGQGHSQETQVRFGGIAGASSLTPWVVKVTARRPKLDVEAWRGIILDSLGGQGHSQKTQVRFGGLAGASSLTPWVVRVTARRPKLDLEAWRGYHP